MAAIRLLGPVELWTQGQRHDLGSAKEQCVLAVLALHCGRPTSVDVLINHLWDERPPPKARETIQAYTSRLRGTLRHALGDTDPIESGPGFYTLSINPDDVDLHRFRWLCRQARVTGKAGDDEPASDLFREAEDLRRGEPLAGLPGDRIQRLRESFNEEYHAALLQRIEIDLRLDRHASAVGELHRLATERPTDERVAELQMMALARCDRQVDALTIYHQILQLLDEEGLTPGSRLQKTHQRILQGDTDPPAIARPADDRPRPNTLPADISDFTGRRNELDILTNASASISPDEVFVIRGMPGVGKTTLAVHTAHLLGRSSHPDGQLYLSLRGLESADAPATPASALAALLRALGIAAHGVPSTLKARAGLWRRVLQDRRVVIVLDDAISIEQIRPLLPGSASCRVLITTQRMLHGLHNAQYLHLDALEPTDAMTLFARLAGIRDGKHGEAVTEIVRRCHGHPLRLQLAAAYLKDHDLDTAPRELIEDFVSTPESTGQQGSVSHFSASLDLAYKELDEDQQVTFRRLGIAPCNQISYRAAAALSNSPLSSIEGTVQALLNRHLLVKAGPDLVGFHDLIRTYAHNRAESDDPTNDRRRSLNRLLDYYLFSADRADRALFPHRNRLAVAANPVSDGTPVFSTKQQAEHWMTVEWQSALQMADYAIGHEWKKQGALLMHTLAGFLETRGHWEEAETGHRNALRACRNIDDQLGTGRSSLELGFTLFRTGQYKEALRHTTEALNIFHRIYDLHAEAEALDKIGIIYWSTAHFRESIAHCQEALVLYESMSDLHGEADTHSHCAISYWHLGRYNEAISSLKRALAIYQDINDRRGEAMVLNNLGDVELSRGYHRDAINLYRTSATIFEEITGQQTSAILQNNLGNVSRYKENHREALRCYWRALASYQSMNDRRNIADVLNNIGFTYRPMERYDEALISHQRALEIIDEIADPYESTRAQCGIGDVERDTGNHHRALDHYFPALNEARRIGDIYQDAVINDGIARTMLELGDSQSAKIHWRQALDLFRILGVPEAQTVALRLRTFGELAS